MSTKETEINDLKVKNTEFDELMKAIKSPRASFVLAGKYGVKSLSKMLAIYFVFSSINLAFIAYAIFKWFSNDYSSSSGWTLTQVLIIGILSTVYAVTRAYRHFMFDIMKNIYKKLTPIFKKLSSSFVEKSNDIRTGKLEMKNKELKKVLRTGKFLNDQKQKLPKLLQKGVWFLIKQIPIIGLIAEIDETVRLEDKEKASEILFTKMETYIENKVLNQLSFRWLVWLIPLNITLQIYFLNYSNIWF